MMKKMKMLLSVLLCLSMVLSYVPVPALAAEDCTHHPQHTADCGYVAAVQGQECNHECSDACKEEKKACVHDCKTAGCTYVEPVEGVDCDHVCGDGTCAYRAAVPAVECSCTPEKVHAENCASRFPGACDCTPTVTHTEGCAALNEGECGCGAEPVHGENCASRRNGECDCTPETVHAGDCQRKPAVEGADCDHQHGDCAYVEAAEGYYDCAHECTVESGCIKLVCGHVCPEDDCGYVAEVKGSECEFVCQECKKQEEKETDEAVEAVKALINVLPTVDAVSAMTYDEKIALHNGAYMTAGNAYHALTEAQKAAVNAEKLMALADFFADPGNLRTLEEKPEISGGYGEKITSELSADGTLTISGSGAIDNNAFKENKEITSVVIEDGVTSIGKNAFSGCSSLVNVIIPGSVTSIGYYAFYKCSSLTTVIYEGKTEPTGSNYVFSGCNPLLTVIVPKDYASDTFLEKGVVKQAAAPTTYTVATTASPEAGGTVTANPTSAAEGAEVTLTVTPAEGYELESITVTDADDGSVTVTDNKFTMPASNVTVTATFRLPHVHDWQYQVKNDTTDTIEAVCKNEDNNCDNTNGGSVTISASGGTYNGSDHKAELTASNDWVGNALTDADISYEYKQNESDSYVAATDLTKAGFYKASITVGSATAYVEYTVAKKELTITEVTATGRTYEKGNKAVAVTGIQVSGKVDNDSVEVSVPGGFTGTLSDDGAGNYKTIALDLSGVTLSGEDAANYKLPASGADLPTDVTITAKSLTNKDITVTLSDTILPYEEGKTTVPTITVTDGATGLKQGQDYVLAYYYEDGKPVQNPSQAGKYTVEIIGTADVAEDYANYTDKITKSFRISRANQVSALIDALPKASAVEPDDEKTIAAYEKALAEYNALSEEEKAEVGKARKYRLEQVGKALTDYRITRGDRAKWTRGSGKRLSFTANGPYSKFAYIEVDGKKVSSRNYLVGEDPNVVTLRSSYLETLRTGRHKIQVFYTDGETNTATFRIVRNSGNPFTGDQIMIAVTVMALSAAALAAVFILKKKKK